MTTYVNSKTVPVKVQYKLEGKYYNQSVGDGNPFDTPTRTSYPFEEFVVAPGAEEELGDAVIIGEVEMPAVTVPGPIGGVVFTNSKTNPVKVQYKLKGKWYNQSVGDGNPFDDGKRTSYPFEEVTVAAGETVELGAAVIIALIEITPTAPLNWDLYGGN